MVSASGRSAISR